MNISYNWLKDLTDVKLPPQELGEKLTRVGITVEGIHQIADDFVFDIDLTSNRPDCLSHLGIARELSAITQSKVQSPKSKVENQKPKTDNENLVSIQDSELCHRFTARIIRNVKIAPSPKWLVDRLEAIGERAINNVADITNYVMHELGQPMHAFDLSKLAEARIVVRRAKKGETIKTLDEVERKLDETMLMICDAEKPVAIGGMMGGFASSITDQTTDVLLEVAYFKRESIRKTSRALNLATEASYRFERGVDIENLIRASNRATDLICEFTGGTAEDFVDVYPTRFVPNEIESGDLHFAVKRLTGLEVTDAEIDRILRALGIVSVSPKQNQNLKSKIYVAPTWRHDLSIEEDLVEEVSRHLGYENIREELPPAFGAGEYQPGEIQKFHLRQTLAHLGFDEAISYSFIDTKNDELFELIPNLTSSSATEKFVSLRDSIIEGATRMRPSLLSGLLEAVRTNFNQKRRNLRLFELGKIFAAESKANSSTRAALPRECEAFALVITGDEMYEGKAMPIRALDFYDAKGALENAITALQIGALEFIPREIKHLRKGQSAEVRYGGNAVGTIGRLSDDLELAYKFKQAVFVAEIDLDKVLKVEKEIVSYRPLPNFPSIERDVSLLISRDLSFANIRNAITAGNFENLHAVDFVDIYEGKGLSESERSLTLRLIYRAEERTLTDAEVDAVHQKILSFVETEFNAKLRA